MLDLRNNYIDFGERLQPPLGYSIDYAVATTYSLDLHALLSIPLAMYYRQNLDSEISEGNFQVLDAIQNIQKHLKIYCQYGKIALPKSISNSLYSFVEKCVVQVMPTNAFQSFHPKVWVLRFKKDTKDRRAPATIYRVIVMSRNLTFDNSYDIAFWMQGTPKRRINSKNNSLINLLEELNEKSQFVHKEFISDLKKVRFDVDAPFDDYSFTTLPNTKPYESIDLKNEYEKRLVVSPFLSEKMVKELSLKTTSKLLLFSRKNELDKLSNQLIQEIEPYYFEQKFADLHHSEDIDIEEYNDSIWNHNLHAKIYLRQNGENTYWDIGSANCSDAAFNRSDNLKGNNEFLIHLNTNLKEVDVDNVKQSLLKQYNYLQLFVRYERSIDSDKMPEKEVDNRRVEYQFLLSLKNSLKAWIEPCQERKNSFYTLHLQLKLPHSFQENEYKTTCTSLSHPTLKKEIISNNVITFQAIPLHQVSSFMHWTITGPTIETPIHLVTKIEIANMPNIRLSSILQSIINSSEKFLALLRAILSDEPQFLVPHSTSTPHTIGGGLYENIAMLNFNAPIYEELLFTLSRSPNRLHRLASIIEKLHKEEDTTIVPKEFLEIWENIKALLPDE